MTQSQTLSAVRERERAGPRGLPIKEDWWAVLLGLGLVVAAVVLYAERSSLNWLAVTPARWSSGAALAADLQAHLRYVVQFAFWTAAFTAVAVALGFSARRFLTSFALLYVASLLIFILGQRDQASRHACRLLALIPRGCLF